MKMKDPICGMMVDKEETEKKGLTSIRDDKLFYFCSKNCKDEFKSGKEKKKEETKYNAFQENFPLILAVILIGGSILSFKYNVMTTYMAVFLIIFSGLKLLDIKGFAKAFKEYDLVANKIPGYAISYPFIELFLGLLFLFNYQIILASYIVIFIYGFGAIGIAKKLLAKEKFTCACLGTVVKVPLTKVTLLENIIMVIMGRWFI